MKKLEKISHSQLLFVLLFIIFGVIVPIYWINRSLHVDESTVLVIGNCIKNGSVLYRDVANVKTPGVFYLAALVFSTIGKSFIAMRVVTYIVHIASAIIVYHLGKKIANKNIGMIASILFLIGAYIPQYNGSSYMTEPYVVFFSLLSVFFFLKEGYRAKFISGLALGMGILFKQTAVFLFGVFLLFYILCLRYEKNRTKDYMIGSVKNLVIISMGAIIPLLLVFLYYFTLDASNDLVYYTLFASTTTFERSLSRMINGLTTDIVSYLLIWLLSLIMVIVVGYRFLRGKTLDIKKLFLISWLLIFSYNAFFRGSHRILLVIPPAVLLSALLLYDLYQNFKKKKISGQLKNLIIGVFLIAIAISSAINIYNLVSSSYWTADDQIQLAEEVEPYIDDGKMYTFPNQNYLFFFSNLTPNTKIVGDIYSTESVTEVIQDLETNNVTYIVTVNSAMETLEKGDHERYSPPKFLMYNYIIENYQPVETLQHFSIYKRI